MSQDFDFEITPPAFDPAQALATLKRQWRELGLTERAGVFERRGVAIARASLDSGTLRTAVVKRPVRTSSEWQARTLTTAAELRDFVTELKKRLAQWSDADE